MLSIFTLSVLGAFGASNVLTDVAERTADDDDRSDDLLDDDMLADGLGGDEDLIERLDMFAALGMTPPPDTPTSEAFLPAEDGNDVVHSVFDFVDDATVADLTPEELDVLSEDMAAAHLDALDDGEPTEIISVAVGGPGAVTPNPTETGFRTQLGPGDELTLNIAPDLPGEILAVHSVFDLNVDD